MVSVCVVTYNHARYIRQALDSVLAQEVDFPMEILVGEDASTDGTREIVLEYQRRHPDRIRVLLHRREDVLRILGIDTGRFNHFATLSVARGKYVALLEGDDYWTDPQKLRKQVAWMEAHPEYALCAHPVRMVDADGNEVGTFGGTRERIFRLPDALPGMIYHANSWLYRHVDWARCPEYPLLLNLAVADTPQMWVLLRKGPGYSFSEAMGTYRRHEGGIWSNRSEIQKQFSRFQCRMASVGFSGTTWLIPSCAGAIWEATTLLWVVARDAMRARTLRPARQLRDLLRLQRTMGSLALAAALPFALFLIPLRALSSWRARRASRNQAAARAAAPPPGA